MERLGTDDSVFALSYKRDEVGRTLPESKVAYIWQISIDGKKFTVELTNSVVSGKKKIFVNGEVMTEQQVFRAQNFQYSWPLGQHLLSIVPCADPYDNIIFELRINGLPFRSFAKGQPQQRQTIATRQPAQHEQPIRDQQQHVEDSRGSQEYIDMRRKVQEIQQRRASGPPSSQQGQRNVVQGRSLSREAELRKMDKLEREMDALERATKERVESKPRRQSRDQAVGVPPASGSSHAPVAEVVQAVPTAAPLGFGNAGDFSSWPTSMEAASGGGRFPPPSDFGGFPGGFNDFVASAPSGFPSGSAGDPFAAAPWPATSGGWSSSASSPWPSGPMSVPQGSGGYGPGVGQPITGPLPPDLISFDDASPVQAVAVQPARPAPATALVDVPIKSTVAPVLQDFDPLVQQQQGRQQQQQQQQLMQQQQPHQPPPQQLQQQIMAATNVQSPQQQMSPMVMPSRGPSEMVPSMVNFQGAGDLDWLMSSSASPAKPSTNSAQPSATMVLAPPPPLAPLQPSLMVSTRSTQPAQSAPEARCSAGTNV